MKNFLEDMDINPEEKEITIREDAPFEMRSVITGIAYEIGLGPSTLRDIICNVLRKGLIQVIGPNILILMVKYTT